MQRAERRFLAKEGAAPFAARVEALEEEPEAFTKAFVARYPQCEATLLCDEDVAYFIGSDDEVVETSRGQIRSVRWATPILARRLVLPVKLFGV